MFYIYRSRKQKKARQERLASVPISNKRIWQEATHAQSDIETPSVSDDDAVELEEPKRAILVASFDGSSSRNLSVDGKSMEIDTMDQAVGWVPQIKSQYGASILAPKPSLKKHMQPNSQPLRTHHTVPSLSGSEMLATSPPPSYSVANNFGGLLGNVVEEDMGRRVDVVDVKGKRVPAPILVAQAPPPMPPLNPKYNLGVPAAATVPSPLPSPARSASFAIRDLERPQAQKIANKSPSTSTRRPSLTGEQAEFPKLMTVVNTYTPNLDDELPIKTGDTVRMLEEFRDGWCVVQHVGEYNAAKGVVPRVCLQERKNFVPRHRSSSSLSLVGSITGPLRR